MGKLIATDTLERAYAVLAIAQTLMPPDEESPDLSYKGFTTGISHGLHFTSYNASRQCNVVGCNVGEGIIFNYGSDYDYNHTNGHALDTATRIDFKKDEYYQAAIALVAWLVYGTRSLQPEQNNKPTYSYTNPKYVAKRNGGVHGENNLLVDIPSGLDKHIKMYEGVQFSEQEIYDYFENGDLPFYLSYGFKDYRVVLGADLIPGQIKEGRVPTVSHVGLILDKAKEYLNEIYEYLHMNPNGVHISLIGRFGTTSKTTESDGSMTNRRSK